MSKTHIPAELRRQVREGAGHCCGYCRTSKLITATELVVDHILPEPAGGPTVRGNLWLVCTRRNQFKGNLATRYSKSTTRHLDILLFRRIQRLTQASLQGCR